MQELYHDGWSLNDVALEYGCSHQYVHRLLREIGTKTELRRGDNGKRHLTQRRAPDGRWASWED